jgi:hypothetical protein
MDVGASGSLLKSVLSRICAPEERPTALTLGLGEGGVGGADAEIRETEEDMQVATFSRTLFVGALAPEAGERVRRFVDSFVAMERARESNLTGVVLLQTRTVVLLVESQPETVAALGRELRNATEGAWRRGGSPPPLFTTVRVVASTEDCPVPLFGRLYVATALAGGSVVGGPTYGTVDAHGEDVAPACWHVYSKLLTLATRLPSVESATDDELAAAEESLVAAHGALLPPEGVLLTLLDAERVTSIAEYVQLFADPFSFVPVGDQVWPPEE